MIELHGRVLHAGTATGTALVLDEPLSFWGGVDPETGRIIDQRHPQVGEHVGGRVLVMASGRGSSSSSTVLAETLRAGCGPAAILLLEKDEILVLGALVVALLDGQSMPIIQLDAEQHRLLHSGDRVYVHDAGRLEVDSTQNAG